MALELPLVEAFVIEHAEAHRQAAKCPDEPELRGDAICDKTELDSGCELETNLGLALHFGQWVSRSEKICVQDVAAVCGVSEITDPARGVETAALELSRRLDVFRPRRDQSAERHIGAGLIPMQAALLHEIVAKLAKPEPSLIVSKVRTCEHTQPYIRIARSVAVAVLQAKADHPTDNESQESGIDEHRRCHDLCENVQNVEHIRIGHQGQVNEFLDLPVSQQGPDSVVFPQYGLLGRMRRPIRAATPPVFKKDLRRAIAAIQSCVERQAQTCDES